jgi:hypothetical protein
MAKNIIIYTYVEIICLYLSFIFFNPARCIGLNFSRLLNSERVIDAQSILKIPSMGSNSG